MAEFQMGFYDLAEQVRAHGGDPGEPLTDEYQCGPVTFQATTTGLMMYAPGGQPLFLEGWDGQP